jgi:hypothetical protein
MAPIVNDFRMSRRDTDFEAMFAIL